MQEPILQRIIKEGTSVSLRKSKPGHYDMIALGEGSIRRIIKDSIYVSISILENRIGDADIVKVFWEDGTSYFCGSTSAFYPLFNLKASCYNNYKQHEILLLKGFDQIHSVEKRKEIRIGYSSPVHFEFVDQKGNKHTSKDGPKFSHSAMGRNLSCSGLEFITDYDLKVNDYLNLAFGFPAQETESVTSLPSNSILAEAKVVRVAEEGRQEGEGDPKMKETRMQNSIALQFTRIEPSDKRLIAEFVLQGMGN